jgi:hypothetical protein
VADWVHIYGFGIMADLSGGPDLTLLAASRAGHAAPSAATISVAETLELLDGPFAELVDGFAQRQYGLWLGSGISRDRVDDLRSVIERVLKHLRSKADFSDPACTYVRALNEALDLAQLSDADRHGFDPSQPFADWKPLPTIVARLRNQYATLLDIRIDGYPADHLLWDVVDVPGTFAKADLEPDCEHLCIAILVIEGVLTDIASANWDGLIEKGIAQLTQGAGGVLRVCVKTSGNRRCARVY